MKYADSELIIHPDGSVFHLHLLPSQLADNVILVGDQNRVEKIAAHFDSVECKVQNREFKTMTGTYKGKRISVVSTGIGTDNIDIVMTEIDALKNIDLTTREDKPTHTTMNIVRIGTSGGLQEFTPEGTFVVSERSIGFDGLLNYYAGRDEVCDSKMEKAFVQHTSYLKHCADPYCIRACADLTAQIAGNDMVLGYTISAPGFYGPQGRAIRIPLADPELNHKIQTFEYAGKKVCNFEMESSAIAGLSALLGHRATTVCLIIANRFGKRFIGNYDTKMEELITTVLDRI